MSKPLGTLTSPIRAWRTTVVRCPRFARCCGVPLGDADSFASHSRLAHHLPGQPPPARVPHAFLLQVGAGHISQIGRLPGRFPFRQQLT
jgi:hypothetical protein